MERIVLRRSVVPGGLLEVLAKHLPALVNLEVVDFHGSEVCFTGLNQVVTALLRMDLRGFTLVMPGTAPGPRTLKALGELLRAHPDLTLRGIPESTIIPSGEALSVETPSRDVSMCAAGSIQASSPRTPSGSTMSPPTRKSTDLPNFRSQSSRLFERTPTMLSTLTDGEEKADAEHEEELELELAQRLYRLQAPVDALNRSRLEERIVSLGNEESVRREHLAVQYTDGLDRICAARQFETPFKPPVFDPLGPLCAPLPLADNKPHDELQQLLERHFVCTGALEKRAREALGESVTGVDGRRVRRARLLPGETLAEAATRFGITHRDLADANASKLLPKNDESDVVWVPQTHEALLTEQLQAERAAATRVRHAQATLEATELRGDRVASSEAQALLRKWKAETDDCRRARESTQALLRQREVRIYERRRDLWLRFLKRQEYLVNDFVRAASADLVEYEETLRGLRRHMNSETEAILRAAASRVLPPSEVELRALRLKARQIESRCAHRMSSAPGTSVSVV